MTFICKACKWQVRFCIQWVHYDTNLLVSGSLNGNDLFKLAGTVRRASLIMSPYPDKILIP